MLKDRISEPIYIIKKIRLQFPCDLLIQFSEF